ncbi:hypothetical protein HPP92_016620 [Vanilla planifolia]|uniref:Uncharacterized protein n=1 Tax=Vanilla planifolia TaxID=51239 RepID=A0A835UQM8_VANPL|nr:hypothetical protein HPP92_016620 [Vanilla planifolia]
MAMAMAMATARDTKIKKEKRRSKMAGTASGTIQAEKSNISISSTNPRDKISLGEEDGTRNLKANRSAYLLYACCKCPSMSFTKA